MDFVEAKNPAEAWLLACSITAKKGRRYASNIELNNLVVLIENPLMHDSEIERIYIDSVGPEYLDRVNQLLFSTKSLKWKTSYRSRLQSWNGEFDQLDEIVSRMQKKPGSKTLTCIVNNPPKDLRRVRAIAAAMPCLTALDFRIRDESLRMTAYFRSQDVFRVSYPDYINMGRFLKEIFDRVAVSNDKLFKAKGLSLGEITIHTVSAFIRLKDMKSVREIIH